MSEVLLVSATADVMFYEDSTKQWLRPGENGSLTSINNNGGGAMDVQKFSNVQLLQGGNRNVFRIVATRTYDGRTLIEQTIFQKLKYQAATKCFHQWRNENRQVYGLSFLNEQDAERFLSFVQRALEYVASSTATNGHHNHHTAATVNGNLNHAYGNGHHYAHSQEAYYNNHDQQQHSSGEQHYVDADEDSLGSANGQQANNAYRKPSYNTNNLNSAAPSVSSNNVIQQQQMTQQQLHASAIQRRASQGSNSSSNNSTNGVPSMSTGYMNGIAGRPTLNGSLANSHLGGVYSAVTSTQSSSSLDMTPSSGCSSSSGISTTTAQPPPPLPPPAATNGVPPISKNAPPPPPPPPPMFKAGGVSKPLNMADSLKQAKLRSVSNGGSNGVNRTSNSNSTDSGIASKTSTINSTTSGHVNLLSELAATIQKRKTNVEGIKPVEAVGERRPNGESAARSWQKLSNASASNGNGAAAVSVDSPRIQRKVVSGAPLYSQEESQQQPKSANGVGSALVTQADLDRFKQSIITELSKFKEDILLAIRQEFAQLRPE